MIALQSYAESDSTGLPVRISHYAKEKMMKKPIVAVLMAGALLLNSGALLDSELRLSLLPRSLSTPFAVLVSGRTAVCRD